MSIDPRQSLPCAEFEELAVLYALGELAGHELAAVEAHAAECASCAALLESEAQWNAAIAGRRKPADALDGCGMLLAQCRSELAEAIDDATHTQSGNAQERAGAFASGGWAWLYPSRVCRRKVLSAERSVALAGDRLQPRTVGDTYLPACVADDVPVAQ